MAGIPYFVRNSVVKVLIVARLRPLALLLGERRHWPYWEADIAAVSSGVSGRDADLGGDRATQGSGEHGLRQRHASMIGQLTNAGARRGRADVRWSMKSID
jgi:hypothetical protein